MVTPVKVANLEKLLRESSYNPEKSAKLIQGFTVGFDLGYRGPANMKQKAPNLKFHIGNEKILWNKVMKEVQLKRFAGPYESIPFDNYIQSPIGLVPKDNGTKTRLVFHLSYPRNGNSVNSQTPKELCTVKYPNFEAAIQRCLEELDMLEDQENPQIFLGKSDMRSAFRNLCMKICQIRYLVMKAKSPIDNRWYYFVDKCLPFGTSISCALFQLFSDAIAHIVKFKAGRVPINYLDDYLLPYSKHYATAK